MGWGHIAVMNSWPELLRGVLHVAYLLDLMSICYKTWSESRASWRKGNDNRVCAGCIIAVQIGVSRGLKAKRISTVGK